MSDFYSIGKYGSLFKQNGMRITDGRGNVIAGESHLVWWWPLNWLIVAITLPVAAVAMWIEHKAD